MGDPLVADGGTVTVGLHSTTLGASKGVYWSLSSAHLNYYGKPVERTRLTNSDSSRLTLPELWLVAFGGMCYAWKDVMMTDIISSARFVAAL